MLISLLVQVIMEEQSLFKRLKILEKTLGELDIEGINKLIVTHQPKLSEPSLEEWRLIVDEYVKRTTTYNENTSYTFDNKQACQRIYEYLMSATLKDCSIIFSFQKSCYSNFRINERDITGQSQFYHFRYLCLYLSFFVYVMTKSITVKL